MDLQEKLDLQLWVAEGEEGRYVNFIECHPTTLENLWKEVRSIYNLRHYTDSNDDKIRWRGKEIKVTEDIPINQFNITFDNLY